MCVAVGSFGSFGRAGSTMAQWCRHMEKVERGKEGRGGGGWGLSENQQNQQKSSFPRVHRTNRRTHIPFHCAWRMPKTRSCFLVSGVVSKACCTRTFETRVRSYFFVFRFFAKMNNTLIPPANRLRFLLIMNDRNWRQTCSLRGCFALLPGFTNQGGNTFHRRIGWQCCPLGSLHGTSG